MVTGAHGKDSVSAGGLVSIFDWTEDGKNKDW